jgi:hypothetical protein
MLNIDLIYSHLAIIVSNKQVMQQSFLVKEGRRGIGHTALIRADHP